MAVRNAKLFIKLSFFTVVLFFVTFASNFNAYAQDELNYTAVYFSESALTVGAGESVKDDVLTDTAASHSSLVYSSDNASVAYADISGNIIGVSPGIATVTATDEYGMSCKAVVTVLSAPTSVNLNYSSIKLGAGETIGLTYSFNSNEYSKSVLFTSSDTSVLTVDDTGLVTSLNPGSAVVYCSAFNGTFAQCVVTVDNAPESVTVSNINKEIVKGWGDYTFKYVINGGTSNYKSFTSSDESVATVNQRGIVKAVSCGKAKITLTLYNGVSKSITVTVVNPSKAIKYNKKATQLSYKYSYVEKYVFGKSVNGRNLEAYIITPENGKYKKTYVMTFAIHGFEDSYAHDGLVLTAKANSIIKYYAENPSKLKNFRLLIIPCLNPDGAISGKNNLRACKTAYGRCTAKHVDMNRDFKKRTSKAKESRALKRLLEKYKPDVFTDFHGWLNETLGSSSLCSIFDKKMHLGVRMNGIYAASSGYLYGYVHSKYKCPSVLVEYKSPSKVSVKQTYSAINEVISRYNKK